MKAVYLYFFLIFISFIHINCQSKNNKLNKDLKLMEKKDIYIINNNEVSKEEFDNFLKTLKEIEKTWFCAEMKDGGLTGYDASYTNGIVYEVRCKSNMNGSRNSVNKKLTL